MATFRDARPSRGGQAQSGVSFDDATQNQIQHVRLNIDSFTQAIGSDAALGFGKKIWSFTDTFAIRPIAARVDLSVTAPDGLGSTAGEVGLGTVVASGAVSALNGTATFENFGTGATMTNLTKSGSDTNTETHWLVPTTAVILDGTSTAVDLFLNLASTWDQTSAETLSITGDVDFWYVDLGDPA